MKMILAFLKGALHYLVIGVLFACLATLFNMVSPKIVQYTVDCIIGRNQSRMPELLQAVINRLGGVENLRDNLWIPAAAVVIFSFLSAWLRYLFHVYAAKGGEGFVKNMRDQLFWHLEQTKTSWANAHPTGDLIQRCTSDVEEVKRFLSEQSMQLITMVFTIIASLTGIFYTNLPIGLIALAGMPIILGASLWFHQRIGRGFMECDQQEGVLSSIAQENLTGVRVVRAFGKEVTEQERFARQNEVVTDSWCRLGVVMSTYFGLTDFVPGFMKVSIIACGCYQCVNGSMTVGALLAVLSYLTQFMRPIRMLGRILSEMSKTSVSVKRLQEIMDAPLEEDVIPGRGIGKNSNLPETPVAKKTEGNRDLPDGPAANQTEGNRDLPDGPAASRMEGNLDTEKMPPMNRDIIFDHVTFSYPDGAEVLHDVSFRIKAGSTLGILGSTGSGKSTLMNLLDRIYVLGEDGNSGEIRIGDRNINSISLEYLRKNIGYVMQEAFLFSRNIRDNIAITRPDAGPDEIVEAADAACLTGVVGGFKQGFETFVGERGVTLSGGQKQRTAIARTLMGKTPILIFDDSLSAVDTETDAQIRKNLKDYMKDSTVIIISHRIASLMEADQILVMEDGRITDRGSHEELKARPGLYQKILRVQEGIAQVEKEGGKLDE